MKELLLSDLFFGILLTSFVAGSYVTGSAILESLELKFYDRCLMKIPDERYQRGAELAADLRKVLDRIKAGGAPSPIPPGGDS